MKIKHGTQAQIARQVGISPQHLNDVLHGRATMSKKTAEKLERETGISATAWIWPERYENPFLKRYEKDA